MAYTYKYPRPAVTVDALIFRSIDFGYEVLLIKRGQYPFEGLWAIPGGFVDMDETLEDAAARELQEETGLTGIELTQLHTFGAIGRDPRHRTISIVFTGFTDVHTMATADSDAADAQWYNISKLPEMAFDHAEIVQMAVDKCLPETK
jgi:8-oxo-dGTP diphosphatase